MSFFGKLSGRSAESALIRSLLRERIERDPNAASMGLEGKMVAELSALQLQASTEGMICAVVEAFGRHVKSGLSPSAALERIERHRARLGKSSLPNPLTLRIYVGYRVSIEHRGPALPSGHIDLCIRAAARQYRCEQIVSAVAPASTSLDGPVIQQEPPIKPPATAPISSEFQFAQNEPENQTFLICSEGGRIFIAPVNSPVPVDWLNDAEQVSNAEEAGALVSSLLGRTTTVVALPCTHAEQAQADGPVAESEPWSEGYLAQRELVRALGELSMPGELTARR